MDAAERISENNYLPITEDIIRMRKGTEGVISESSMPIKNIILGMFFTT